MSGQHRRRDKPVRLGDVRALAPMPDRETGCPSPPEAPGFMGSDTQNERSHARSRRHWHEPKPPSGCGPVFAWRRENARGKVVTYIISFGILFVGATIIAWIDDGDWMWFRFWQLWVVLAIGAYLMSRPLDLTTTSAGADWYQRTYRKRWYQRRTRRNHIMTYELTRIQGTFAGASYHLHLEDAHGNSMERILDELQPDRTTWNLVYNGLQHSIATGAEIDPTATWLLSLTESTAIRQRDNRD